MTPRTSQRGSSLPETAIVMAALLALMFGIIDFGRATYTYAFVAQLARQGARWAMVRGSSCTALEHCNASRTDVQNYVQSLSQGATIASNITVPVNNGLVFSNCPAGSAANNAPGCTVSVTVQYPFTFMLPYMPKNGGGLMQITMSSTSQMVISQ
jgi:Flp pilus assembly protein TadG